MKAESKFINVNDYVMEITLSGTLGEFQKLVGHLDKNWQEPMNTFMKEIHNQVDIIEKQVTKKFDLS